MAIAMARMRSRGETDRLEREGSDFHQRVHAAFVAAADPRWQACHREIGPVYSIDASGSPDSVTARCLEQLATSCPTRFAGAMNG